MTAFAFAGKCGFRGLRSVCGATAARAKSASNSDASAAPKMPPGTLRNRSRRLKRVMVTSIHIQERGGVHDRVAVGRECLQFRRVAVVLAGRHQVLLPLVGKFLQRVDTELLFLGGW